MADCRIINVTKGSKIAFEHWFIGHWFIGHYFFLSGGGVGALTRFGQAHSKASDAPSRPLKQP
jgi:hypothetical protein